MTKPAPFMLRIPDADIADLRDRLARTRFPDSAPGEAWAYGTDVAYLRHLVDYWRGEFDWRAEEAALNVFPQFRTSVDGIDLHYLHVPSVGENPMPLLLLHGWPGSVFEFVDIIPRLTDPLFSLSAAIRSRPQAAPRLPSDTPVEWRPARRLRQTSATAQRSRGCQSRGSDTSPQPA